MSNRRAQDERIEGTPDGSNAITEITDVPDAPTIGTATAGLGSASVAFTPATTGGTASLYTATSNPGSITGTSATSPISVSGLTAGTSYTFTVRGSNSTGTGPSSSASNSVSPSDLVNGYDALASTTLSTSAASITFSGIPAGYTSLELRGIARCTGTSNEAVKLTFNGDIANNYSEHHINGNGSSAVNGANSSYPNGAMYWGMGIPFAANIVGANVTTILDYADTDKYKTIRSLDGFDANGSGGIELVSSLWQSNNAIVSITLTPNSGVSFAQYTEFSLYGVK